jgi:ferric-dicitrate binding protein FerR (iron transport regulator)
MNCHEFEADVVDLARGAEMSATAAARLGAHLEHCAGCAARFADERRLTTALKAMAGVHVSVETKVVTGAPYTADATSESVQVLADGNRIVRRTTSRVYRDGKGRTRRETLGPDGQIRAIVISDPAAGKSFAVDPGTNTVHATGVATFVSEGGGRVETFTLKESPAGTARHISIQSKDESKSAQGVELKAPQPGEQESVQQSHVSSAGAMTWVTSEHASKGSAPKKEDLGQKSIEGLIAKGTRTTTEIPAGAIGNDLPIVVTGEEWVSVDLKVLVMTRHAIPARAKRHTG